MLLNINGEPTQLNNIDTIADLVKHLELTGRIAIEINRRIIPQSQFPEYTLSEGDIIEIVHAIGGGSAISPP